MVEPQGMLERSSRDPDIIMRPGHARTCLCCYGNTCPVIGASIEARHLKMAKEGGVQASRTRLSAPFLAPCLPLTFAAHIVQHSAIRQTKATQMG